MTDAALEQRVDELCALGELAEAARLLAGAGQHLRAARLFEQACDFGAAAVAALDAPDLREAMRLVVLTTDERLTASVISRVVKDAGPDVARAIAADLSARSYYRHGAALLRGIGAHDDAAEAFERAGRPLDAASSWDSAGHPTKAARALEGALRGGQEEHPDQVRIALGELYARHDKHEAAVRVLQQIGEASELRRKALGTLVRSLEALGLRQAIRDLEPELQRRGVDPRAHSAPGSPTAPPSSSGGAVVYGRYEVVREVARTPHARLLEAIDKLSGERVAVKILASKGRGTGRDALSRFVREAEALTRLRHPNVVPLREFVAEGPAMILAWMEGGSLRDLIDRETISPARAVEIARAVLDALAEAHRLDVLHRDVKPSNLLFDAGGSARLADFGAAHMSESDATVTVGEIGTVAYMAPEQRAGRAATVQSDVYGVGVMLYEMLTGELPPQRGEVAVTPSHPDLDGGHDALIRKFLAADPAARFAGALQGKRALEALSWPSRIVARERKPRAANAPAIAPSDRFEDPRRVGQRHDRWLGRDVIVLSLTEATLARAAAIARAGHEALPAVLRADRHAAEIWIDAPRGRPLSQGFTLGDDERARLAAALAALHAAGGAHGAVDADHVFVHAGAVYLAFAPAVGEASPERDMAALAAL